MQKKTISCFIQVRGISQNCPYVTPYDALSVTRCYHHLVKTSCLLKRNRARLTPQRIRRVVTRSDVKINVLLKHYLCEAKSTNKAASRRKHDKLQHRRGEEWRIQHKTGKQQQRPWWCQGKFGDRQQMAPPHGEVRVRNMRTQKQQIKISIHRQKSLRLINSIHTQTTMDRNAN